MQNRPLISMMILSYRNTDLIYDALDSVLEQDYTNIELIISDDCSEDFDSQKIKHYIQSRNRGNIKRLLVNENEINMGLVRHLNKVLRMSNGEYLKFLAADDALYDGRVLSDFVKYFEQNDSFVVASQCMIFDSSLKNLLSPGMTDAQKKMLQVLTPEQLYCALTQSTVIYIPSVCFTRGFFEKYGPFDENYRIDEDWPTWLRISRLGCKIHFMDRITVKYRMGGISNSNSRQQEQSMICYVEDLLKIWTSEILPNRDLLGCDLWERLVKEIIRRDEWPLTFSDPPAQSYF